MKTSYILIFFNFITSTVTFAGVPRSPFCSGIDCREPPSLHNFFRIDCRFHNVEHHWGVGFCYASAVYQIIDRHLQNVHLGVGCDRTTLYNDLARVQIETTLDRFSPFYAATPGLEVFPQGQLGTTGTYTSVLDIAPGRFKGLCYVHPMFGPL